MAFSSFSSARWKIIPSDSVPDVDILSCSINPSGHKTIRHLTIFSSSLVNSNRTVKQGIIKKISKFTTNHHGASSDIRKGDRDIVEGDSKTVVTVSHQLNLVPFVPFESKSCHLSQKKCLFRSKKFKSIILLNIISIVYASNIPLVKEVETNIDPAAFSAVRFAVSAIPFLPFVFWARDDRQTRNAGVELGLWVSLGYLIEALGLLTAEAGRASFISLFTVIVVPLLESLLGAVIPARTWFGVLMSVLGVVMLECSGSPPNVGDLLNFLSAIFFGIHMLRTEHISKTTKKENFMALLGYEVCVVAVLSTIWYLITGCFDGVQECDNESWTFAVLWNWMATFPWIPTLYTGVFSTGLCLWAEIDAMRDVSATETAIIYGLEPLWGAGFAWFLLGERWDVAGWIGAALVLGGSLTVQLLGSTYRTESTNVEKSDKQGDLRVASYKKRLPNTLSTAPVIISFRKDVIDMLKKK